MTARAPFTEADLAAAIAQIPPRKARPHADVCWWASDFGYHRVSDMDREQLLDLVEHLLADRAAAITPPTTAPAVPPGR